MLDQDLKSLVTTEGAEPSSSDFASRPRSLTSNATWSIGTTLWNAGLSFLVTSFLIAEIGDAHYGLYVLLMSIAGLLGFINLGLGEATLRYVGYYYADRDVEGINRVVGASLTVQGIAAMLGIAIVFPGATWIASWLAIPASELDLTSILLRLTAVNFGLALLNGSIGAIPQALQRFDVSAKVAIFQSLVQVGGSVVVVLLDFGLLGLVLWLVVTSLCMLIVNSVVAKRLIPSLRLKPMPSRNGLREVFGYGVFSLMTGMLGTVWSQADRILLGVLVSASTVAYLTVPWNLAFRLLSVVSQTGTVLFARFSMMKEIEERRKLYLLATWAMLSGTIAFFVPLTILVPDLLRLWINPAFAAQSSRVGQIVAASCILRGAFIPYEALFKGIGKPQYLTRLVILTASTSLALNLALIPRYGLLGAGYSYCVTPVWGLVTVLYAWRRVLEMQSLRPLLEVTALPILVGFGCLAGGVWFRSHLPSTIGWLALGGLSLFLFTVVLGLLVAVDLILARRASYALQFSNHFRTVVLRRMHGRI